MTTLPYRITRRIVRDASGCWLWTGALNSSGYAHSGCREGTFAVHRLMFEFAYGSIPEGHHVHHTCEIRSCVNPDHLIAVSAVAHNVLHDFKAVRASVESRLARTHCPQGHPYAGDNLYITPREGWRQCRTCGVARNRAQRRAAA